MQNAFWQSGSYSKWFLNIIDFITIIKRLHWNVEIDKCHPSHFFCSLC